MLGSLDYDPLGSLNERRLRAVAIFGIFYILLLLLIHLQHAHSVTADVDTRGACLSCRGQRRIINGIELIHQFPPEERDALAQDGAATMDSVGLLERIEKSSTRLLGFVLAAPPLWKGEAKGLVLFVHGCGRSARDFWDAGPGCTICHGLPEEKKMVSETLHAKYIAVAVSSPSRGSECWDTQTAAHRDLVSKAIEEWKNEVSLGRDIPLFAYGLSSGAIFATSLPRTSNITALAAQASEGAPIGETLSQLQEDHADIPPLVLVTSERDSLKGQKESEKNRRILRNNVVQTRTLKIRSRPIDPHFFSTRIQGFPKNTSERLVSILEVNGFMDSQGYLTKDPRSSAWRPVVLKKLPTLGPLDDRSPIVEELNVAWAAREANADFMPDILRFFDEARIQRWGLNDSQHFGPTRRYHRPWFTSRLRLKS